jgi:SPP1 family predicted phage head-tail adaptor
MTFDRPIVIQTIDQETEQWSNLWPLHARINKTTGSEYVEAGADRSQSTKTFEVRYFAGIEDIDFNRGLYRIIYRGHTFNIVDYDDYMESHQVVKLKAVSYGD